MDVDAAWIQRVRPAEYARVEQAAAESRSGRSACVLISGAPGMGKSRLLRALAADSAAHGAVCLYGGVRSDRLDRLGDLLGQFADGLGSLPAADRPALGSPDEIAPAVARLSAAAPVLICVDDADRLDRASSSWLADLLAQPGGRPVLVAAAMSLDVSGRREADFLESAAGPVTLLPLRRLVASRVGSIVADVLGDAVGGPAAEALFAVSGGNPLLLDSALAIVADFGVSALFAKGPTWYDSWDTYTTAVTGCLRGLPPSARSIADALAVLGPSATPERLGWLTQEPLPEVSHVVAALRAAGLLDPDEYRFPSRFTAQAVERGASAETLSRLHDRAARMLFDQGVDIDVVANHLRLGSVAADPWVTMAFREAAQQAIARHDWESAAKHLRRSLIDPAVHENRITVLAELALTETFLDPAASVRHLHEALRNADEPAAWERMVSAYVDGALRAGRQSDAAEFLDTAAVALEQPDPDAAALVLAHRVLFEGLGAPLRAETVARFTGLVASTDRSARVRRAVLAVAAAREQRLGADPVRPGEWAREALAQGSDGIPSTLVAAVAFGVLLAAGKVPADDPQVVRFAEDAQHEGSLFAAGLTTCQRAERLLADGEVRRAYDLAEQVLQIAPESQWDRLRILPVSVEALAALELGRTEKARNLVESPRHASEQRHLWSWPRLLLARAHVHAVDGRWDLALAALDECALVQAEQHWANPEMVPVGVWRPPVLAALGRVSEAQSAATDFLAQARSRGGPELIGAALRSAGQVATSPTGIAQLAEAVEILSATRARLEWIRALIALGTAQHQDGRNPEARATLRAAWEAANRIDAMRSAADARDALVAAGGRLRRPAAQGPAALTPSQLRVCLLAEQGVTNREIAQELFVSVRAVELHLSAAYRKLAIRGRSQLKQALQGDGFEHRP